MKDISNNRQPSFLFMKVDNDGNKYWRLNYNIVEKVDENNNLYYECDFVPESGGLVGADPTVALFTDLLKGRGLTEEEINVI